MLNRRGVIGLSASALIPCAVGQDTPRPGPSIASAVSSTLGRAHPRLLVRSAEVDSLTAHLPLLRGDTSARAALKILEPDPRGFVMPSIPVVGPATQATRVAQARAIWRAVSAAAAGTQVLAFRRLVLRDAELAVQGTRRLLSLCTLPFRSPAEFSSNPEAFVQLLHGLIFTYDWLADDLTQGDRETVRDELSTRLATLSLYVRTRLGSAEPLVPADGLSYPIRFVPTLGHGALALLHDRPEALSDLAWVCDFYVRQFPVWGGADGGWAEGLEYHSSGLSHHLRFLEDLANLGSGEPLALPFWRNTGYFMASFLMPYETSSFADLPRPPRPTPARRLLMEKLARIANDGRLMTLAPRVGQGLPGGINYYQYGAIDTICHLWRSASAPLPSPASLASVPLSRHFRDIGWVAMHSGWQAPDSEVMLGFKSSPMGSVSHAFAEQNALVINAFGRPLAISTGVRDWYGSPHYEKWTRATKSKNAVLINGQGQETRSQQAIGRVVGFASTDRASYVKGDATLAYADPAKRVLRHVLFVDRRFFVVLDEIATSRPSTCQWLLHTPTRMSIDPARSKVVAASGGIGLTTHVLVPDASELRLEVTDRFEPIPDSSEAPLPEAWHLSVGTARPALSTRFLVMLQPWRGREPTDQPRVLDTKIGLGMALGDLRMLLGSEDQGLAESADSSLAGAAAYHDQAHGVMLGATEFVTPWCAFLTTAPVSCEFQRDGRAVRVQVEPHPMVTLRVRLTDSVLRLDAASAPTVTARNDAQGATVVQLEASEKPTSFTLVWQ